MRIAHVAEAFGGGVLSVVSLLAAKQVEAGHEVALIHGIREETPFNYRELIDFRVNLTHAVPLQRNLSLSKDLQALGWLRQQFASERYDVIHLHSSKAGFLGRVAARLCGHKAVVYSPHFFAHCSGALPSKKRIFYRELERVAGTFGGVVVACSADEYEAARALGLETTLIENAVDNRFLESIRDGTSGPAFVPITVATSGRISAQKNPALFEAVAYESRRLLGDSVAFLWIGGGDGYSFEPGLVEATGWMSREAALQTLRSRAHIYLQSSSGEGMSMSILEAMGLGVPVVATRVTGNQSTIHEGKTGLLGNDAQDLARHIVKLTKHQAYREQLAQGALEETRSRFAFDRLVQEYENLYRRLADA